MSDKAGLLAALAVQGLVLGCGGTSSTPAPVVVDVAEAPVPSSAPSSQAEPEPVASNNVRHAAEPATRIARGDKECCKGKNDCKALGGCKVDGVHGCKGQNDCKALGGCRARDCNLADLQVQRAPKACCKGMNECKGKGNCKTQQNACKGLNPCKARGGCKPAHC